MENMKMSDVFDLPLQRAVNELAIVDKNDCVVGWADAFSGEVARDCIVESINNHDRLIEENKQQRESLDAFRDLVKAQTKTMSELNEENLALQQENADLRESLEGAMRIKDLWLPMHIVANEHEGEAVALHSMYKNFEAVLSKIK